MQQTEPTTQTRPTVSPRWPVVLFDLDGTLADSIDLIVASYQYALDKVLGHKIGPEVPRPWIGRVLRDLFVEMAPEHVEELVTTYREWNDAHLETEITDYPGINAVLEDLLAAGVVTGIATSKRRRPAELSIKAAQLPPAVPLVGAAEDTTSHKPNPEPLLQALDRLGADPAQAVYVGDAVYDIEAARAAGMGSVAVTWGAGKREDLIALEPDALVDTAAELRAVLLGP